MEERDMTTDWYAPNQQAVRPDGSGPAEEGHGGGRAKPAREPAKDEPKAEPREESKGEPREAPKGEPKAKGKGKDGA
jgi:hypothetical protein